MEIGLLVLRLVVGVGFGAHGAQKLFGAFGGGGIAGTGGHFEQVGLRPGRAHALAAGVCEFGGGLLIAVGLVTPFAAAALIGVMTAAVLTVHATQWLLRHQRRLRVQPHACRGRLRLGRRRRRPLVARPRARP